VERPAEPPPRPAGRALAAAALALALAGCHRTARPGLPPRNLVLVTVEDLSADHMSCYTYVRPTTWLPSDDTQRAQHRAFDVDELAHTGVVFANAFAPVESMTLALVTLFTGRSPRTSGALDFDRVLADNVPPTLAEALQAAGFETVALVTHVPPPTGLNLRRILLEHGFETAHECSDDQETLERARMWLAERDFGSERPFFLWLHLGGLLLPWRPDPDDPVRFTRPGYDGPARRPRDFMAAVRGGGIEPSPADWEHLEGLYDGVLHELTEDLAGILAEAFDFHLADAEVSETWARTAFVLTAPTGTDFQRGWERLGHARNLSEAQLHVPLILRHPDSLTGERVFDEIVELADVMPTVLEWLEVPVPAGVDGRSLFGVTDRGRTFASRPAFATMRDQIHTVRTPRWRLIWDPERKRRFPEPVDSDVLLFDVARDPDGLDDVAAEHPDVVRDLVGELRRWTQIRRPAEAAR
jgi:arylsulfatase A-like enzyme